MFRSLALSMRPLARYGPLLASLLLIKHTLAKRGPLSMQHVAEHAPVPACLPAAYLALGMQHVAVNAPMPACLTMRLREPC
eukprot:1160823-Pelagomonas_calceolata.AAC.7